jgi:hypothetical protein
MQQLETLFVIYFSQFDDSDRSEVMQLLSNHGVKDDLVNDKWADMDSWSVRFHATEDQIDSLVDEMVLRFSVRPTFYIDPDRVDFIVRKYKFTHGRSDEPRISRRAI